MSEYVQNVGVDMGFGWMKVWAEENNYKFPAVISRGTGRSLARVTEALMPAEVALDVAITDEDNGITRHYFVGDLAIREGEQPTYIWSKNKVSDEMSLGCFATALALVADSEKQDLFVITGLPIAHFGTDLKASYEDNLSGGRFTVNFLSGRLEGKTKHLRIVNSKVFPQGYGVYLDQLLDDDGRIHRAEFLAPTGILDIGFKTTDVVYVHDMQPVDKFSFPLELGMSWAYEQVQRHLSHTYDIQKSLEEIEGIFHARQIRLNKEHRRIDPWIESAYRALTDRLKNEIARKWANLTELDTIVVAGGGGAAVYDYLDYPQKMLPPDAQYSNAKGFWKAGNKIAGSVRNVTPAAVNS